MKRSIVGMLSGSTMPKLCFSQSRNYSSVQQARITVNKLESLMDETLTFSIHNLRPRQKITLHSSTRLPNNALFECFSHYVADDSGCILLNREKSCGGTFTGVEPMGPLSFMLPSSTNARKYERFMIKDPTRPFSVDLRIFDTFLESLDYIHGTDQVSELAKLTINRTYMAPGVREYNIREGRVRGTLYLPAGDGPFPGVISMSGGYPGAMKHKAALLASHGFAAIALKYFGEDDLPDEFFNCDLEYIEEACVLLRSHPQVDGENGIGIIANCYGGHLALGLASVAPRGLIRCVVSVVGWPVVQGNIRYKNAVWEQSKNLNTITQVSNGLVKWMYDYNEKASDKKKDIFQFQDRFDTSYMFITAGDDGYLLNDKIPKAVEAQLKSVSHPDYQFINYPGAGHLIENAYHPHAKVAWTFGQHHDVGGSLKEHVKAQEDSWPKILDFTYKRLTGNHLPSML